MLYSFTTNEFRAFKIDLSIMLIDLNINSELTQPLKPRSMKPINNKQEKKINNAFIVVLMFLSIAQVLTIIIFNTL